MSTENVKSVDEESLIDEHDARSRDLDFILQRMLADEVQLRASPSKAYLIDLQLTSRSDPIRSCLIDQDTHPSPRSPSLVSEHANIALNNSIPSSPPDARQHPVQGEPTASITGFDQLYQPHTPANKRQHQSSSSIGQVSSAYYTAVWGSPYGLSSPITSRSVKTAPSEQPLSDGSESPYEPEFDLDHLIPARLRPPPRSSADRIVSKDASVPRAEEGDPTPRSRTKSWVQLPKRQAPERPQWWSDSSGNSHSDTEPKQPKASGSSVGNRTDYHHKGHKAREQNRTLDQESFWNTLRDSGDDKMSGLSASRWAATPEQVPAGNVPEERNNTMEGVLAKEQGKAPHRSASISRHLDDTQTSTPDASEQTDHVEQADGDAVEEIRNSPSEIQHNTSTSDELSPREAQQPVDQSQANSREKEEALQNIEIEKEIDRSQTAENAGNLPIADVDISGVKDAEDGEKEAPTLVLPSMPDEGETGVARAPAVQTPVEPTRLEPPRFQRRISWRGRKCLINIPYFDFDALGLEIPLTPEQVQERLKRFRDEGYCTSGFDVSTNVSADAHAKPIYPDEAETRTWLKSQKPPVTLPDLNAWEKYMDALTEAKLAALGVSFGEEESIPAASQDMSRQASGQYPAQTFSPPIPTGSAASIGRPGLIRGHSHTMSVISPMSPSNAHFGHMHRQSSFHGGFPPMPMQQQQESQRQPLPLGIQAFSPPPQMPGNHMLPRMGSPAQVAALRNDLNFPRGPGSPLSHFSLPASPQEYSQNFLADQHRRQATILQQPHLPPSNFVTQRPPMDPAPALPKLPEDEGEAEELSDPTPYMPPQKRAQINDQIAVPTPQGHRHNISEGLEREVFEAEQRRAIDGAQDTNSSTNGVGAGSQWTVKASQAKPGEKDPLGGEYSVLTNGRSHKKSASRFNFAAPSFTFNPNASFEPGATVRESSDFSSKPPKAYDSTNANHTRRTSSGNFNVAAKVFKPSVIQTFKPANVLDAQSADESSVPTSEFSFSAKMPSFKPGAPAFEPPSNAGSTSADELPSIFGKVDIPDIIKPARRSRAVEIVKPDALSGQSRSSTDVEDESGRIGRGDDGKRRFRASGAHDGNDIPQFAEPHPVPSQPLVLSQMNQPPIVAAKSQSLTSEPPPSGKKDLTIGEIEEQAKMEVQAILEGTDEKAKDPGDARNPESAIDSGHKHGHQAARSSLSALAQPWQPAGVQATSEPAEDHDPDETNFASVSSLEEGEVREHKVYYNDLDDKPWTLPGAPHSSKPFQLSNSDRVDVHTHHNAPSFDEIDAVMRQLNAEEPIEETHARLASPLPDEDFNPENGVTYIPAWPRSDAPSPSPTRKHVPHYRPAEPSFTIHENGQPKENVWINRLNKSQGPPSDWSDLLSPGDDEKLQTRSAFFDNRIDDVVGRVLEDRLQPFENVLRDIQSSLNQRTTTLVEPRFPKHRSSSAIESDADDEDEVEAQRHRPISRGRDQKLGHIKAVVLEALREQSPRGSEPLYDIADLHSALADMKVSFARAASASLELEDIRAIVEDVVSRQSQALVPIAIGKDGTESQRQQLEELEGRLNETLTGALEQANHTRQVEQREAETRRMLKLAEEELDILRDTNRDDGSRVKALLEEHATLLEQVEEAEDAQMKAETKLKSVEQSNEAMHTTLEEYRLSSTKWRQEIDDSKREREELEMHNATVERQLEEAQDNSNGMRRRLERIHTDMATAMGQIASEKTRWKSQEEQFRVRCEGLEAQNAMHAREKIQLAEELSLLRAGAAEAAEARMTFDGLQSSNASLNEVIRSLRVELVDQQTLAARFDHDFKEAREAGRTEVHRIRLAMQMDIETANHQVTLVRAELGSEVARLRAELDHVKIDAEADKEHHGLLLEQETDAKREALRKVNQATSVALDEARSKYESAIKDLTQQHGRSLAHAIEDKERSEYLLNERLVLANAKLQHYEDRVLHLEERVEIAKSAAQAAAMSAQTSSKAAPVSAHRDSAPERISPQALRESILVLQEQLQDRETRIEELESRHKAEAPKVKERDTEIAWLRELLAVRSEDLAELVNTLSRPTFDRDEVRDAAIRIRANLQMEQQEKERFGPGNALPSQALASLSSFATPKAAQLTSAFNKWRSSMESSALRTTRPASNGAPKRSYTPSRKANAPRAPAYMSGLMTPPTSNLRNTPSPEATKSLPAPRLSSRGRTTSSKIDLDEAPPVPEAEESEPPTTPTLLRAGTYDEDAEDNNTSMSNFEDDDLNVADSEPPAFRSVEAETAAVEVGPDE